MTRPKRRASDAAAATRLRRSVAAAIRSEARRAYPVECCGVLLAPRGESAAGRRRIVGAVPVPNAVAGDARRFRIPADAIRRIERREERHGRVIAGFYHSHPDAAATPSALDAARTWPWYTHLIVPVEAGGAVGAPRAWRLAAHGTGFTEETLVLASHEEAW